jgi:uncharacterized protein (DUF488 family)
MTMTTIFTIGHSTRSLDELIAMLREQGVDTLVDVRTIPRSRRHPQFNAEHLAVVLPDAGIAYRNDKALGGRRGKQQDGPSPNPFWTHAGFRNYADYALTLPFRAALLDLERTAATHRPAIMCAEALWWKCHRRIITDYLLADGNAVTHILGPGKSEPARITENAVRSGNGALLYPEDPAAPRLPGL